MMVLFQGTYLHNKEMKAAIGIKITAQVLLCDIKLTSFYAIFFIQLSYSYKCLSFLFIQGLEHAILGTD